MLPMTSPVASPFAEKIPHPIPAVCRLNHHLESTAEDPRPRVLFLNRSYWPDAEATGQLLTELCEDLAGDFAPAVIAGRPNQNPAGVRCRAWGRDDRNGVSICRVPHVTFAKRSLCGRAVNMLSYLTGATAVSLFSARPA